ncbi:MAG TPA: ATP-binding protein [Porphyromonadaceae bacterium]|nr:ATP-binding protein [Porphyromonadaceae bacterium]
MKWQLKLTNNVEELENLEEFIQTVVSEEGLSQELGLNLNLVLEEATTNVILYAYPEGTEGSVEITATLENGNLSFSIVDSGKPFDPTQVPEADTTLSAEDRPIGGLGIFLIRKVMDKVYYERKGNFNCLTMEKSIW